MATDSTLDLTHALFQVIKQLPRVRLTQSSAPDIKGREYDLLGFLALNRDPHTQTLKVTDISNLLQVTPAAVTHLLNALEDSGCIERKRHPNDRRVVLIALTAKGEGIANDLISQVQDKLTGLVAHLGGTETETLVALMSKMLAYFDDAADSHK